MSYITLKPVQKLYYPWLLEKKPDDHSNLGIEIQKDLMVGLFLTLTVSCGAAIASILTN